MKEWLPSGFCSQGHTATGSHFEGMATERSPPAQLLRWTGVSQPPVALDGRDVWNRPVDLVLRPDFPRFSQCGTVASSLIHARFGLVCRHPPRLSAASATPVHSPSSPAGQKSVLGRRGPRAHGTPRVRNTLVSAVQCCLARVVAGSPGGGEPWLVEATVC